MKADWHTSPRGQQKSARTAQLNQNCFLQKFRCFVSCTRTSQLRASHGRPVLVSLFFLIRMPILTLLSEGTASQHLNFFHFYIYKDITEATWVSWLQLTESITHFPRWRTASFSAFIITCFLSSLNSKWLSLHLLEKEGNVICFLCLIPWIN